MIDDGSNKNDTDCDSPVNKIEKHKYNEPRKFRIEVMGCNKQFLFMVQSSVALRQWTQALYANWHASRSFTITNSPKLIDAKFWKVKISVISKL